MNAERSNCCFVAQIEPATPKCDSERRNGEGGGVSQGSQETESEGKDSLLKLS